MTRADGLLGQAAGGVTLLGEGPAPRRTAVERDDGAMV